MPPRFLDLEQEDEDGHILVDKQPSVHVEVADGHLVDVPVSSVFDRLRPIWPFTCTEGSVYVPTGLVETTHRLHRLQRKK
jgi:hypothetical protein